MATCSLTARTRLIPSVVSRQPGQFQSDKKGKAEDLMKIVDSVKTIIGHLLSVAALPVAGDMISCVKEADRTCQHVGRIAAALSCD